MPFAPVGTIVAATLGGPSNVPSWGTGQNRNVGDLLICWSDNFVNTVPTISGGWNTAVSVASAAGGAVAIFWRIATGGDAAPTVTGSASGFHTQLGEFSGGATASPVDKTGTNSGTATPIVATASAADVLASELLVYVSCAIYTTAATRTLANALNNGATAVDSNNNTQSVTGHYDYGYGITTSKAAADSTSFSMSTVSKISGAAVALASFLLAPAAPLPSEYLRHRSPVTGVRGRMSHGRF